VTDINRSHGSRSHSGWLRAGACLALTTLGACASFSKQATQADIRPWPEIRADVRVESLRARMYEYSITFAAEVDLVSTSIERRAADSHVRRNAMLWRLRAVPEMRKACFRLEAVSALIDAWTLTRQMDHLFSAGAGAGAFGPFQAEAVAVSRRLVDRMREIGGSIAASPQASTDFEKRVIDPWLAEHPLGDLTFARESPMARFADQSRARGDTLQSVGTMEDLAVSLSQQARIYLADLPRQLRGELELTRSDMLPAEDLASMQGDLRKSAAAADRLATTAETLTPFVTSERRIIIDEMSRQRSVVMDAISAERELVLDAIISAFAVERSEMLRNFESQRRATLDWATAERHAAVDDVRKELAGAMSALREERAVVLNDTRRLVDSVLLRIAIFLIAGVVLAPLVAHAYVRVWPRRPEPPA
jgi:hypothetical protein